RSDSRTPCILIADDQPDVLEALRFLVKGEGYQAESVNSPPAAIDAVESRDFDAVLMDLNYTRDTTSGQEGLELLNRIQALDSTLPIIVMTAWGSVELAVEAMRRGARDFIQKPWDNARLTAILKTQIELGRALRRGQRLEDENRALRAERFPQLIAQSAAMRPVLDVISRVGPSDANVFITGENGTGKGLVAQTLTSVSLRSTRALVQNPPRPCARLLRHHRRSRHRSRRRQIPPGPALPPQHHRNPPAPAARSPRRYLHSRRPLPPPAFRPLPQAAQRLRRRRHQ